MDGFVSASPQARTSPRRPTRARKSTAVVVLPVIGLIAASLPTAMAQQQCIPLRGSTTCPAFSNASISTGAPYPFLAFVSDVQSFDDQLRAYIQTDYARRQYQERIGCSSVNLTNTTEIYARYTTSVLCNFIVQASIGPCGLEDEQSTPLCAPSCGEYAISEQEITSSPELCGSPGNNALDIIRADYQDCSVPARALSGTCIEAADNEPAECGYQSNLPGLCAFCGQSSPNATDSCCVNANVETRCRGVELPETTSMPPLILPTGAPSGTAAPHPGDPQRKSGLSGGAIAGIVIGSIVGAAILLGIIIFACIRARRAREGRSATILNTPSPTRGNMPPPQMAFQDGATPALAGARVARMSALEQASTSDRHSSRAGGVMGAYRDPHDDAYSSADSGRSHLGGNLPKRDGSLSSSSVFAAMDDHHSSPHSGSNTDRNFSSPEGLASGQSEQLQFFKDYYSQDDIHPNDVVATLWAYQPRANDEFELERGDMLKVVGIWDDGWATGVRLSETAEQWEARKQLQRDSGVSNYSRQSRHENESEIKAFPLVCVCLPQHWRKTIEGDSTDTGPGSGVASSSSPSPVPSIDPIQLAPLSLRSPRGIPSRAERRKTPPPSIPNHSRGSSTLINSPRRI